MKIAIIGAKGYPIVYGGYETFVSKLAPGLTARGVEVHVYCYKQLFNNYPAKVDGIFLHYIPFIAGKKFAQWSHSFLSTLHALFCNYDVILYVNAANGIFGILTHLFRQKTAINVDGIEWLRPKWKGLGAKVFYFSAKMAIRWMDRIITDAVAMQQVYLQEFQANSTVIAYGATISYGSDTAWIRQRGLEKNGYYLIVGRLIPDNNADLLIEAYLNANSSKKLVIIGDVPYKDPYAENIKGIHHPKIVFTGYVNDANELDEMYQNCFAYFHGHEFGGTNPTLLTALANGCAVMALDTVFSREVLEDGKYGLLFSKNIPDLSKLIAETEQYPDSLIPFQQRSRSRIEENYTWEKIVDQYFALFEKM